MGSLVRRLHVNSQSGIRNVDVTFADPVERRGSWMCKYEIGWPEGPKSDEIWGADAVQALYMAMQAVALVVYASSHHRAGRLYWDKPGRGYGFPMPKVARAELIGEDRVAQA